MKVFTKNEQYLSVALTLIFIFLSIWQVYSKPQLGQSNELYLEFLTYIVLGGAIHVVLTFFMMFTLPEFKTWLLKQRSNKLFVKKLLVIFSFFVFTNIIYSFFRYTNNSLFLIPLNIFWVLYPIFHVFSQSYGILVIHNQNIGVLEEERKFERKVFDILMILIALNVVALIFYHSHQLSQAAYHKISVFHFVAFCGLALLLFRIKNSDHQRNLFLLRIFLYPLSFLSGIAGLAIVGIHGLEYFFITKKIVLKSEEKIHISKHLPILLSVILIAGLYLINTQFGLLGLITNGVTPRGSWYKFVQTIAMSFTFAHYYLDGLIFRMKDPISRQFIGPLFR